MTGLLTISAGRYGAPRRRRGPERGATGGANLKLRSAAVAAALTLVFAVVGGRLVWLAAQGVPVPIATLTAPATSSFARPDIVDRSGRLLATDVALPSLYADPLLVIDRDELTEKLAAVFPDLDTATLRADLAEPGRRFLWIRRGLSPSVAQRVHNLGLPGLAFRNELKRAYPAGRLAGHAIGAVNIDNKGLSGIERAIDESGAAEPVVAASPTSRAPIVAALDMGVQHALEDELAMAMRRTKSAGAAGLVLDVASGEVLASASLPGIDPLEPALAQDPARIDKITGGSYELGSVFKAMTIAMVLEGGTVDLGSMVDVTAPLDAGRKKITDLHPPGRPLSVAEVFTKSSNVGAGQLALAAGADRQRQFLDSIGLLKPMTTEAGPLAAPQLPARWDRVETITIAYGHGIAVAPLQFAAAAATLVNGGFEVRPTLLRRARPQEEETRKRIVSARTSARIRDLMRRNVDEPGGTGRRAAAEGYRVGGKTGTAELAVAGGYSKRAVLSSFLGAFPIDAPEYVTLVMLFEPKPSAETGGGVTAGVTAAPLTSRLVTRIAPLLGVNPAGARP